MFFSLPSPKHVLLQNGCSNSFKELCLYKKAISGSENAKRWQSLRRHLWSWRRRECRGLSSQTIKIQSPERVSQKSRETKEDELRIYMNLWSVMICHRKKLAVVAPSFTADCVETLEDKHVLWILLHFRNESVNNAAKWCTTMHNAEHVLLFTWSGAWHNWSRGIPRSWRGRTRHEPQNSRDQTFETWISLANLDLPFQTELHITHITVRRLFVGHVSAIEELYMFITHHVARCCTMLHDVARTTARVDCNRIDRFTLAHSSSPSFCFWQHWGCYSVFEQPRSLGPQTQDCQCRNQRWLDKYVLNF